MKLKGPSLELVVIIITTIIGTFFFAYVAYVLLEDKYPGSFISIWRSWDSTHYLDIARYGYTSSHENERNLQIVFFPLYPYVVRLFFLIFRDYLFSALAVSNLAYAGTIFYLYKLTALDYDHEHAMRTAIYISVFPTAYILHAPYTESLFLLLTLMSFYYARTNNWAFSGIAGMFAAATRVTGILLLPVLVIEYLSRKEYKIRRADKDILWLGVIAAGLIFYLYINYAVFGNPFKFLEYQKGHWFKELALPVKGFLEAWRGIYWRPPADALLGGWAEIIFAVMSLMLVVYSFFRLRLSYSLYALLTWLTITSTAFWLSIPRYILSIFPLFIVLSILGRRREINYLITFISLLFYALLLSQFVRIRWGF